MTAHKRLLRHCIDAFNRGKATSPQRSARGDQVGANPADRAKPGFKLHLAVEGGGLPLSLLVTRANTNDSLMFEALLDDIPAVRIPAGQRRRRPQKVHARQGLRPSPLPRLSHPPRDQGPHRPL